MADVKAVDVNYAYRTGRISDRRTEGFGYLRERSYI
jgi:hypothetical protein